MKIFHIKWLGNTENRMNQLDQPCTGILTITTFIER